MQQHLRSAVILAIVAATVFASLWVDGLRREINQTLETHHD